MNSKIKFLHNSEIDIQRWDQVVGDAVNSRVYAFSWYLYILHPNWHGLIYGDYDYVMPVIFSKKCGIKYAFQPIFSQQHGIFPIVSNEIISAFIQSLETRFRYIDISLNSLNKFDDQRFNIEFRKNYLLSLEENYSNLFLNYRYDCKRNVKKAIKVNKVFSTLTTEEFISFVKKNDKINLSKELLLRLEGIVSSALKRQSGQIYGAFSDGELSGASFVLIDNYRYTILHSVSSELGRKNRSMHAIIDAIIHDHCNKPFILDFEGSNIEGVAQFFRGFGSYPEIYQHIKLNNLPWIVKLVKK